MSRIIPLAILAMAASMTGCAICDTCDDFPAPCNGPYCGHNHGVPGEMDIPGQGAPVMGTVAPTYAPADDAAGPAPAAPAADPNPPVDSSLPPPDAPNEAPTPMDPVTEPK